LVLQVSVKMLGEILIFAGIADEAGGKLDRLVQKRGQILDQAVGKPDVAQERIREPRRRIFQRLKVNDARSRMRATVKASHFDKNGAPEYSHFQLRPGDVRAGEVRRGQVRRSQVRLNLISFASVTFAQDRSALTSIAR
jgi:hypothetical protein